MSRLCLFLAVVYGIFVTPVPAADDARIELRQGDRICLIGNALAERFQYFGYFETLLQKQFPDKQLVVRNLGFCGDEVRFRPRSLDFGSPDQHLELRKADVVFAFLGFNESFKGDAGLATFEQELDQFITHTLAQKYNGESAPRLVLFSPIAHETLETPNLPDGSETNPNLEIYSRSMAGIAAKHGVPFVDLFQASLELYESEDEPVTFNGIHISDSGYRRLAPVLMQKLFGTSPAWSDELEPLRAEVLEKNFNNFHDFRAVNGFYIYGGRSRRDHSNPPYTDAYVIENERAKLREMAAVVDQRIWTVASGGSVPKQVDYSGTRELYKVPTNFNQPIEIKSPEQAMEHFTVAKGYQVNLFASEREFPDLENPVNFTWDTKGRLWVATMPSYPQYRPPHKPNDKLLILEDTDGDGKADKQTVFADGLHLPTGFELGDGGAYVAQEPNLMFLKDTDGDGIADQRKLILHGFDSGDSHHAIGAFVWGPGGGIYMHEGTFHITQVETPWGPQRNGHGAVYRFDPTKQKLETFVSYNFANPWGHCWDEYGQNFVADASGGANYFGTAFSTRPHQYTGQDDFGPFKFTYQKQMQQFFPKRVRPTAGCEIVSSRHFPPDAQGNYLLNNCIGFQGVLQHTVADDGSGFVGKEIEPLLFSSDRNFRPTDIQFGPDGALYVVDWFNPLIGHMQHSLRDPNRDHTHGRIWRITYPSRPLLTPPKIDGATIAELLELLKSPELRTRQQARTKLREFPKDEVVKATYEWVNALDNKDESVEHHKLEALWVLQHHNAISAYRLTREDGAVSDDPLDTFPCIHMAELLQSPDHRVRAAATRVLGYWHEDIGALDAVNLLREQAGDDHPRVRLEAVRAASWIDHAGAAEAALVALKHPTDYYIDYALQHTISRLEEFWKPAVGAGKTFAHGNPKAVEYIISLVSTSDLINMARSEPVFREMLHRHGVVHQYRHEALMGLAKLHKTDMLTELLAVVGELDKSKMDHADHVLADMTHMFRMQDAEALKASRNKIAALAKNAKRPIARRVATVALITADGSIDRVWNDSISNSAALRDAVDSVALIPDNAVRESAYERVAGLISKLPAPLEEQLRGRKGVSGRFVRIELKRRGTLTLAEVEVMSGGKNIARGGRATQSSVAFGGPAGRAIDGNTSPIYGNNGQTHTKDEKNPWWEVDLGSEQPIESIKVYNRNGDGKGQYGERLEGFVLTVLDANREQVFRKGGNKAPLNSATIGLNGNPRLGIQRSAIAAISYIPNHDDKSFRTLAPLVSKGQYRASAVQSLGRLRRSRLPKGEVRPVIDQLLTYIASVPEQQRTRTDVMDAIQLGKDLSGLLAKEEAISIRRQLSELAVDVIVIRPIPHRMRYDRDHIYVQAGKRVEIVFENTDIMPHNIVFTQPGAREEVGILAEKLGSTPAAFAKQFIPDSDKVLHASGMLQPDQQQRLQIVAPGDVGDYPFVCTFPGHWRTMYGTMHVVADISDIPLNVPEPTDDPHSVPKRQFVRKWTMDDVLGSVAGLESGRSFENGRRLFTEVSCVACHAMNEKGGKVGPDLADVKHKMAVRKMALPDIVESLTHPSKVIEKKYRTQIIITDEGKPYAGVIVYEDDDVVRLAANPLDKNAKIQEVPKDSIDEREESKVSIMPEGLMNTMTKQEILDLLAYIISAADPEHASYR